MNKERRILVVVLTLTALVILAWWLSLRREPSYRGRSLTVWLNQYETNRWPLDKEAEAAIQHFGSNASPVLLKIMSTHESPVVISLLTHVPSRLRSRLHVPTPNEYRLKLCSYRRLGASGFRALSEQQARPVVPALIRLLGDPEKDVRYLAVFALRCLGPVASEAFPALTNCLSDPEFAVRDDAVKALGAMRAEPERAVPLIIEFAGKHRWDPILCCDAINSLREFQTDAKPACPLLVSLLYENDPHIRAAAASALKEIDPALADSADKMGLK